MTTVDADAPPPLVNSYWLLPGQVVGGKYPGGSDDA